MKQLRQFILLLILCLFFHVQSFSQREAFESYYLHIGDYPRIDASPGWGEGGREVQGITHDDKFWYITATEKFYLLNVGFDIFNFISDFYDVFGVHLGSLDNYENCYLWKIPVSEPLDQAFRSNSKVKVKSLLQFPELSNIRNYSGYNHWGDVDHFYYFDSLKNKKVGYLLVPSNSNDHKNFPSPAVIIFRADDLSLVGFGKLTGAKQKDIGWCAVDTSGYVYCSNDNPDISKGSSHEGTSILKYKIDWKSIKSGYNGDIGKYITFKDTLILKGPLRRYSNGTTSTNLALYNMQGGEFSPSNELLYLSNGTGKCKGFPISSSGAQPNDGIHVIDTKTWKEIKHSTNHDREDPNYFDYHYDPGCGIFEFNSHSAEGLTIWDLDDGRAPHIRGQLHVLVADVFALPKNTAGIEHFSGKLRVNQIEMEPATLNNPISGTDQRPFFTFSDAYNFYPAWDGVQITLKKGSYGDIGHYSTRIKISSSGGSAIIGSSKPEIQGVVLYENKDYKGNYHYFDKNIPDLDVGNINFNDMASSLRLNNIKEVILYEDRYYRGTSITIKANRIDLDPSGWNDRVSSIKIIQ